jgi:hypothetical protein
MPHQLNRIAPEKRESVNMRFYHWPCREMRSDKLPSRVSHWKPAVCSPDDVQD